MYDKFYDVVLPQPEIWKGIKDFEEVYEVSNYGRVRSLDRINSFIREDGVLVNRLLRGKILKNSSVCVKGYQRVSLHDATKGNEVKRLVHRLVAEAFIPNKDTLPEVNHKSTIKTDNKVLNLEWVSGQDNVNHFTNSEFFTNYGEDCGLAILTEDEVLYIRNLILEGFTAPQILQIYKDIPVKRGAIQAIVSGENWQKVTGFSEESFHIKYPNQTKYTYSYIFKIFNTMQTTGLKAKPTASLLKMKPSAINSLRKNKNLILAWENTYKMSANFKL